WAEGIVRRNYALAPPIRVRRDVAMALREYYRTAQTNDSLDFLTAGVVTQIIDVCNRAFEFWNTVMAETYTDEQRQRIREIADGERGQGLQNALSGIADQIFERDDHG